MVLTNNFTNDSRVLKEGITLVNAGYSVKLVCFGNGVLPASESVSGIQVKRIYLPKGKLTILQSLKEILYFLKFCIQVCLTENDADIVHCHDLYPLPLCVVLKWLSFGKKKLVYDTHEYQTEISCYMKGSIKKIYQGVEGFFIRYADAVLTVSDGIANEYKRLYGIRKPHLVLNCPPYREAALPKDLFRQKLAIPQDSMIFLYQGGLSIFRGIERTLEAFNTLSSNDKVLVVMGYGPLEPLVQKYVSECPERIFFHASVAPDDLLDYTASADVGILCYDNVCLNHYYCSPNKFFEYTMASIPIITSNLYEIERIMSLYGNGVTVDENVESMRKAVQAFSREDVARMKVNIDKMKKIYSWEEQEKNLLKAYDELKEV